MGTGKVLNVGVVGVGTFGSVHAEAYATYHRSKLAAVCDVDRGRGTQLATRYGCDYYADYADMIQKGDLDAVSIATPDFLHLDPAVCAAESGLGVLLEKPMATTVEDASAILSAFRRSGSVLMVDFHNRWSPPFVSLKRAIDQGEMGSPRFVQTRLNDTIYVPTKMLAWAQRSNVLWFLGSHVVDLCRWILGSDPTEVYAVSGSGVLSSMGIDTPDFYQSIIQFRSGAVASIENCWILPETHPAVYDLYLQFVGERGSFNVNASHSSLVEKYTTQRRENPDVLGAYELHGRQLGFVRASIWHFVDCVLDGQEPLVTGQDGLWVTRTICGLLESARTQASRKVA